MTRKIKKIYLFFFSTIFSTTILASVAIPLSMMNGLNNSIFYESRNSYINKWLDNNINSLPTSQKVTIWNKYWSESKISNYDNIVRNFSENNQLIMKNFLLDNFGDSLKNTPEFYNYFNDIFTTINLSATYLPYPNFFSFSNLTEKSFIVSNSSHSFTLSTSSSTDSINFARFNFKYNMDLGFFLQIEEKNQNIDHNTLFCLFYENSTNTLQKFFYLNKKTLIINEKNFFGFSNWCKNFFNII